MVVVIKYMVMVMVVNDDEGWVKRRVSVVFVNLEFNDVIHILFLEEQELTMNKQINVCVWCE